MTNQYKPENYNSLSPYIIAKNASKLSQLLKEIFGAAEIQRFNRPDGGVMHMELRIDDSVIMMADSTDQYPPNQSLLHVYVSDAKEVYRKAIELGCKPNEEPEEKEGENAIRGAFFDWEGNFWTISTHHGQ